METRERRKAIIHTRNKEDKMKYYPIKEKWQKVKKHLNDEELNEVLIKDFNKFTYGRLRKSS
jgi:hypothetical protein